MSWLRAIPFLFTLLAFVLQPASASAFAPAHPEARVSAFGLVALASVGASAETSLGLHEGIAEAYDETASGYRFAAKGGTYKLRDPETGQVRRTGKTKDLSRRRQEHKRGKDTKDLDFEVDRRSDSEAARRGREQRIYDQHPEADLNKRRPISPRNPRRDEYLREGDKLE